MNSGTAAERPGTRADAALPEQIQTERLVRTFLDLVQLDSESRHERAVADYVKDRLLALGYTVEEDDAGEAIGGDAGNVLAFRQGSGPGRHLLFCAHMDTVAPGVGVRPVRTGGVIASDGTTVLGGDDKAGIAAILEAAEVLAAQKEASAPHQFLFTVAEEAGLLGAKHFDVARLGAVDAAFFLDSEGLPNEICVASPHHIDIAFTFHGRTAHAGVEPEKGVSAIQMAARAIAAMPLGRLDAETTANIGILHGGQASNVVCDEVTARGEARSMRREKVEAQIASMIHCAEEAASAMGGTVETSTEECYAAVNLAPDCETLRLAAAALGRLGLSPKWIRSGGGSDANVFCGRGVPAANLGVGMRSVHSVEEELDVEAMRTAAEFILAAFAEAAV